MKTSFNNRNNIRIVVELILLESPKGIAFVSHGMGGYKEQPHIVTFSEALNASGYSTVRWDMANTIGQSGGRTEDTTVTSYYEDLEDVISWANTQEWYQEPFVLCGHSLGGMIICLYAETHPEKVKALIPVSSVVAGHLSMRLWSKEELDDWKRTGIREEQSKSKPGVIKRFKWDFITDFLTHDVLKEADKVTMPILLIVGSEDQGTTPGDERQLYLKVLSTTKQLSLISGADHDFRNDGDLDEIHTLITGWMKKLDP